jgi:hypothetical protein
LIEPGTGIGDYWKRTPVSETPAAVLKRPLPGDQLIQHGTEGKNVGVFIGDRSLAVDTPIE